MGAGNVKRVYAEWAHALQQHRAALGLLAYMANTSRDGEEPPLYYGGRERLARALGKQIPARASLGKPKPLSEAVADLRTRQNAFKAVERHTRILRRAGAITSLDPPTAPYRHATYQINLKGPLDANE
jgi:hypothetical protein